MRDKRALSEGVETSAALHRIAIDLTEVIDLEFAASNVKRELECDRRAIDAS